MEEMSELRRCPFCGQKPEMIYTKRYPWWNVDRMQPVDSWTVCCMNDLCIINKAMNMYYPDKETAEKAWNRRDDDDPALQEVPGDGIREWQREIMDRDRDLQRGSGSAEDCAGKEQ